MVAGFPVGYAAAAPAYTPNVYAGANPAFPSGKNEVALGNYVFALCMEYDNYTNRLKEILPVGAVPRISTPLQVECRSKFQPKDLS